MMNIKQAAVDFRVWQFCDPLGWNVTPGQIAEGIGENVQTVNASLKRKGWQDRVRTTLTGNLYDITGHGPFANIGIDSTTLNYKV